MGTAWQMPIAVIGKPTGDGRQFDEGALSHRDLPLPLRYVATDSGGHNNAVIVGHIAKIGKEKDGMLPAKGEFYDDPSWPDDVRHAATAAMKFTQNKVIGPSVDLDQAEMERVPEPKAYAAWTKEQRGKLKAAKLEHAGKTGSDCGCGDTPAVMAMEEAAYDGPHLKMVRSGRVASATLVHIPAFAELSGHAKLTPIDSSDPNVDGTTSSAMVAGALVEIDWSLIDWDSKIENDAEMAISEPDADDDVPHRAKAKKTPTKKRDPETVKGSEDTQEMAQADDESDEEFAKRRLPSKTKQKDGDADYPAGDGQGSGGAAWANDDNVNRKAREKMAALMAGAAPVAPPKEWFDNPGLTGPTPLHIGDDGHVYGHVAVWDTCHVGIGDSCVKPPKSLTSYAYFHTGETVTADGGRVAVGRLTYGGGHAQPNLGYRAAAEHYDSTSHLGALVRAGEDDYGIWVAGAVHPETDEAGVRAMRSAPLSGDWRRIGGNLEMVAALHVNTAGFPIPRMLTAGAEERVMSLTAAGVVPVHEHDHTAITAGLNTEELGRAIARGMLAEQQDIARLKELADEREKRAAEWLELVAAATREDLSEDYAGAVGDLLVALGE